MRILKVALFALLMLLAVCVLGGPKKIKVYVDAPNKVGQNETFVKHVLEWMRIAQDDDKIVQWEWVEKASDAKYIIAILSDKNKLPVLEEVGNVHNVCYQYMASIYLWERNSHKTIGMMNQQLDCNIDEMAKRVVEEILLAMGVKPGWEIRFPGRMQ